MTTNNIDKTHIVALQEVNGELQYVELPIDKPKQLIAEIEAMIENPNRTVWDMQSHFKPRFPMSSGFHNYLFPYSYTASYVSGIQYPAKFEYAKLKKSWEAAANEAEEEYKSECKCNRSIPSTSVIKIKRDEAIASTKLCQKKEFFQNAIRWIDATGYADKVRHLKNDNSFKMYSKENIGWNSFSHKINNDVVVELHTNFGYGSAAYFLLGVNYKGLPILPYSYIVKYYNANMADIVRCTRSYQPTRESWCAAFDFISDFVNNAKSDPESFIKNYIMDEVKEMMKGLDKISENPKSYMENIANRKPKPYVISVRPMFSNDRKRLATYPDEAPVLFKVEKITGALSFLKSLKEIAKELEEVQSYIDHLYQLNMDLYPEIEVAIAEIKMKIETQKGQKNILETQISTLLEKLKPFEDEIQTLRDKLAYPDFFNINDYADKHPNYKKMKNEKCDLQSKLNKVLELINGLSSFVSYLNNSISILDKIKQAA